MNSLLCTSRSIQNLLFDTHFKPYWKNLSFPIEYKAEWEWKLIHEHYGDDFLFHSLSLYCVEKKGFSKMLKKHHSTKWIRKCFHLTLTSIPVQCMTVLNHCFKNHPFIQSLELRNIHFKVCIPQKLERLVLKQSSIAHTKTLSISSVHIYFPSLNYKNLTRWLNFLPHSQFVFECETFHGDTFQLPQDSTFPRYKLIKKKSNSK